MNESWIKETMELIEDWEKQRANIEDKLVELGDQTYELEQRIAGGHALVRAYVEKYHMSPLPPGNVWSGYFGDKSYPEMLVEIAQESQGYLKVLDAIEIMAKADVSGDRRAIQANVYSALRRMKKRFIKMRRGEYRYTNHVKRGDEKPSGVRQAVKELKEKRPEMTKEEVLNHLIRSGFDFKGKNPTSAINITWAYLGYSKEGKQQSLLGGIDAHRLAMLGIREEQKNKARGHL